MCVCVCVCVCVCLSVRVCVCVCAYVCVCIHACMYVCVCLRVCVYACVFVCIWSDSQVNKETRSFLGIASVDTPYAVFSRLKLSLLSKVISCWWCPEYEGLFQMFCCPSAGRTARVIFNRSHKSIQKKSVQITEWNWSKDLSGFFFFLTHSFLTRTICIMDTQRDILSSLYRETLFPLFDFFFFFSYFAHKK